MTTAYSILFGILASDPKCAKGFISKYEVAMKTWPLDYMVMTICATIFATYKCDSDA